MEEWVEERSVKEGRNGARNGSCRGRTDQHEAESRHSHQLIQRILTDVRGMLIASFQRFQEAGFASASTYRPHCARVWFLGRLSKWSPKHGLRP